MILCLTMRISLVSFRSSNEIKALLTIGSGLYVKGRDSGAELNPIPKRQISDAGFIQSRLHYQVIFSSSHVVRLSHFGAARYVLLLSRISTSTKYQCVC